MLLLFVHGWSVTNTDTYGGLPEALELEGANYGLDIQINHIYLGRYISFNDEVSMDDIARAFHQAIAEQIPGNKNRKKKFSCITHSTGGPAIRLWVQKYFGSKKLDKLPLKHLVMLAPANHGSALAQLGKERVGRIKAFFSGIEPGVKVLNWLELGSKEQTELNRKWLEYEPAKNEFYPVVLTGQNIDNKFYDFLNSYLVEPGSDGVVRVCGANMNYRYLRLIQTGNKYANDNYILELDKEVFISPQTPLGVIPDASHSGDKFGIMKSVTRENAGDKPVVAQIMGSLKVNNAKEYKELIKSLIELTNTTQKNKPRFTMFAFIIKDQEGNPINDFDLFILAGNKYSPNVLPKGFFQDKQRNSKNRNRLIYFLNAKRMLDIKDGKIGFKIQARPQDGFVYYSCAEFHSENIPIKSIAVPNQTVIIEIILKRNVDKQVFQLDPASEPRINFKKFKPDLGPIDA